MGREPRANVVRTTPDSTRSPAAGASRSRRSGGVPRILIADITPPNPDGHPARRIVGDSLEVGADLCSDDAAALDAEITYKVPGEPRWRTAPLRHDAGQDRWIGAFRFPTGGLYRYAVQAWIDPFAAWRRRLRLHLAAAAVEADLLDERERGAELLRRAAERAESADRDALLEAASALEDAGVGVREASAAALGERVGKRMRGLGERQDATRSAVLEVIVERKRARVGSWCVLAEPLRPEPSAEAIAGAVQRIVRLGFDVLCLPAGLDRPHRQRFMVAARALGLEVALAWEPGKPGRRRRRAIASHAFWGDDSTRLWEAELATLRGHIRDGVRAFAVSQPQAWPLPFWSWLIATVHADHPDVVFVCAAAAAPKRVLALARLGFSQSVRDLPRLTPGEHRDACARFAATPLLDVARPHVRIDLRAAGPAAVRRADLLLAATLSPALGVVADPELLATPAWAHDMRTLLRIRRENRALQSSWNVAGLETENPALLGIWRGEGRNDVLVVVNLDPERAQEGWLHVPPELLPEGKDAAYPVRDLLTGATYTWRGPRNFVRLDPQRGHVGHVLRVERSGLVRARRDAGPGG
jgi:starch synthase (maltosyl-transferring)